MRDILRLVLPFVVVGIVAALVDRWVIHHWRFSGKTAGVVIFVTVFIAIGLLSYWFGRLPRRS